MSVTIDLPQCVRLNVEANDGEVINITDITDRKALPDSRYITLRKQFQPLLIAELEVFGGKFRFVVKWSCH